ncbi:MAG: SAM-dependent methyltransferase [Prochlorococcus sp. SP3034]|nr:SAM-dependent methyltransferase [Prochlorococcus sp. SP3034]|tara:strand:- start:5820 stop:6578 length:759 start_codon:yes stop_codon:yes gene_type:complete
MNINDWNNKIKNNFNAAAKDYSEYCLIQKYFSKQIVNIVKELKLPEGNWFDLGSGTGILADELEKVFLGRSICRVDFCKSMLLMNKKGSQKILWDLNKGLHPSIKDISLLVSNFCIHWLDKPETTIKEWFKELNNGGQIIIAYPTSNCFPEWKTTCKIHGIKYSGLDFPEVKNMLEPFSSNEIISSNNFSYKETFPNIYKLFRSIIKIGAQSSQSKKITIGEFKKLAKHWPKNKNKIVILSWEINILVLKKI